MNKIDVMHSAR